MARQCRPLRKRDGIPGLSPYTRLDTGPATVTHRAMTCRDLEGADQSQSPDLVVGAFVQSYGTADAIGRNLLIDTLGAPRGWSAIRTTPVRCSDIAPY
jgi:hypothetical protein